MAAYYHIHIKERLDVHRAAWFDDLIITHPADGGTRLAGTLADQSALYGLIGKLRDLGLTLISLQAVAAEQSSPEEERA
jgi:hypothetical protein